METWAVLGCLHAPYHDPRALDLTFRFLKDLNPHGVIYNGDLLDFYAISRFNKDPLEAATLDEEITLGKSLLQRVEAKRKIWLGGNHEDRLRRYIWAHTDHLRPLGRGATKGVVEALSIPALFETARYGFEWHDYGELFPLGHLFVTHGIVVSSISGGTARAHFERFGTSILVNHSHRLGSFYRRYPRNTHGAWENGCLCNLDPPYLKHPNWMQGFSIVHVDPRSGLFHVQQIPILGDELIFGNQVWRPNGRSHSVSHKSTTRS